MAPPEIYLSKSFVCVCLFDVCIRNMHQRYLLPPLKSHQHPIPTTMAGRTVPGERSKVQEGSATLWDVP